MRTSRLLFFGLLSCFWILSAAPGAADGAVATGVPSSVVKNGVAQGYSVRAKTPDEAREVAMGYCGDVKKSSKEAVALCKVVKIFRDQCVALALDPQPGTPGYGWGIGIDKDAAGRLHSPCALIRPEWTGENFAKLSLQIATGQPTSSWRRPPHKLRERGLQIF